VRAAAYHRTAASSLSVRAAFTAHTRGGWRAARRDGDGSGVLAVGHPATYAIWDDVDLVIDVPDERVSRWSTDPRAGVAGLPDVAPGRALPRCLRTVVRGRVVYDAEQASSSPS
jgi:predicted amidohydrolase YtcJ